MKAFTRIAFALSVGFLSLAVLSCGGGGGGSSSSGGGVQPSATIISGHVVDGFVAGATVTAYQVNPNGTRGAQIGASVTTDQFGNYTLNLGSYTGPVYLVSQGGTYIDAATGNTIDLSSSSLVLSALVPNASGNVTAEINPFTTMAASVALTLIGQGNAVSDAAAGANGSISDYFGLSSNILFTALVDLTKANCMSGATQQSADASAILAGISQLAENYGVNPPDLIAALIQDVMSDGLFDGSASGTAISVVSAGSGTILLSTIEGPPPGLTGLANAITAFMNSSSSNVCGAHVDSAVVSALSTTNIFSTPPAPTGVQATAQFGAALVSWNPVPTATSYTIYMATSTGVSPTSTQLPGFTVFPNMTSPAVVPTGLTSTTYYFVVTAVSGTSPYTGYESAPSAERSAYVIANTFPAQWGRTVQEGSNASSFAGVATASDGSAYAAGHIAGTGAYNFGNSVTTAGTYTGNNLVLVKYTSSGTAQWARSVNAGNDQSSFLSVSVATDGSVYAAGYINGTGTYDFGNNVTAAGAYSSNNIVLVKYNSTGTAQWARTVTGGSNLSAFLSVSAASDGSIYAAGYAYGTSTYGFGNGITATGTSPGYNPIVVKYNSSGTAQWARSVTAGASDMYYRGLSVASDGSVYAAGYVVGTGTYNFGNNVTIAGPYTGGNLVLVKYDSLGTALWARTVTTGPRDSFFTSVAAASDGSAVYAAGYISGNGTYNFGNSVTAAGASPNGINTVLVKYDSAGNAQWARTTTAGSAFSIFFSVSAASDGSSYAVGYIDGTGTFNFGNNVTAAGKNISNNIVLVKYDSTGTAQWAQTTMAGSGNSVFNGVTVSSDGAVYAVGDISGTGAYNFGGGAAAQGTFNGVNLLLVNYKGPGSIGVSW